MEYTLAVLTSGRGSTLNETLRSFRDRVEPQPTRVLVHSDHGFGIYRLPFPRSLVLIEREPKQRGFCGATAGLWRRAVAEGSPYVFWLEHDFTFKRRVYLEQFAQLLDRHAHLAQVQLMRNPVNETELAAGGLFESRPGEYKHRSLRGFSWWEHQSYFTTNPSLMRHDFMEEHPFLDDGRPECEGRYGIDLVQKGFSFAVWGDGSPWCEHVGIRSGTGY